MSIGFKRKTFGSELEDIIRISTTDPASDESIAGVLETVMVTRLVPGTYQPRRNFDEAALRSLSDSIKEKGVLQPIIVRKMGAVDYEIIAGERRWRAAQMAGLQQVPVIIRKISNEQALAFGIIENIQRKDLNPIEEAYSFKRLLEEFKLTHEEVAKTLGRSRATISNMLRLLDLSEPVKSMLETGKLQMGHARAMLTLSHELQSEAALEVEAKQLSVRATENLVRRIVQQRSKMPTTTKTEPRYVAEWKRQLEQRLPAEIIIKMKNGGGGQVLLKFDDPEELRDAMKSLLGLPELVKKAFNS